MASQSQSRIFVDDVWHLIAETFSQPSPSSSPDGNPDEATAYWKPKSLAALTPHLSDLISLSSTCSYFRDLLGPRIFKSLYLQNSAKSARSVQAVAAGRFSGCVSELRYAAAYKIDSSLEELYPPELDNVLSNLSCFNSLQLLSLDFPFDHSNIQLLRRARKHDTPASTIQKREDVWRGFVSASFGAITSSYNYADNNAPQFRSLEIHNLNPVALPTIATPPFHALLSRLKSLKISLDPPHYLSLHRIITPQSASISLDNFGPWLFNHLTSLEDLSFNPSDSGPHLGNAGQDPAYILDIGLRNATMPRLKSVTLANIFICAELTGFLRRHLAALEGIALLFCRAYVPYSGNGDDSDSDSDSASSPASASDNGADTNNNQYPSTSWSTLFKSLSSANPPVLKSFTYTTSQDELILWSPDDNWLNRDLVEAMRRKREAEPDTLLFPHYEVWDGGGPMRDMEANIKSFLAGEDYRAFLGLRGVLKGGGGREEVPVEWDRKRYGRWKYIPVSER